jgi:hypothetical protein
MKPEPASSHGALGGAELVPFDSTIPMSFVISSATVIVRSRAILVESRNCFSGHDHNRACCGLCHLLHAIRFHRKYPFKRDEETFHINIRKIGANQFGGS